MLSATTLVVNNYRDALRMYDPFGILLPLHVEANNHGRLDYLQMLIHAD
jgi:hypothetical protein